MDGGTGAIGRRASLAELEAKITELAGQLNAATYRWLMLIAEFDDLEGWSDGKLHSCAHWLNFKVGLSLGAAREKVRVAHALAGVPKIAASMARGELSYSKVRALTRVATPATEDTLLMIALHGTAYHVEKTVRYFRRVQQAEELSREAQQQAARTVDYWYDTDGSLVLKARLPALAGAVLVKALEHAMTVKGNAEERVPYAARRADALALVAETYLQNDSPSTSTADRFQVVVHVDAETLQHRAEGRCHLEEGPTVPIETLRRLTCDASLVRITENEQGEPLDVGRKTRTIPPAIRRALNARDSGCCFPGCTYRRFVDAHHVEHWADGGETKLSNLVTLCRAHHRLVHEGDVAVEARAGGGWLFRRPDGREFDTPRPSPSPHDWLALRRTHAAEGIHIDADTAATRWRGERMDYDLGIGILCDQAHREKRLSGILNNHPGEPQAGIKGDAPGGDRDHDHDRRRHGHHAHHDVPAATFDHPSLCDEAIQTAVVWRSRTADTQAEERRSSIRGDLDTCETLHLFSQVVGKTRLALTSRQNHWWNVPPLKTTSERWLRWWWKLSSIPCRLNSRILYASIWTPPIEDDVRRSADPDQTVLDFLAGTYDAAATIAMWDRANLDRSCGSLGQFALRGVQTAEAALAAGVIGQRQLEFRLVEARPQAVGEI